jgi:hypothetical protein
MGDEPIIRKTAGRKQNKFRKFKDKETIIEL